MSYSSTPERARQDSHWDASRGPRRLLGDFRHHRPHIEPGPQLVEIVDKRIEAFAAKYCDLYPAAMRILLTDKAGLTAYLRFPRTPWARSTFELYRTIFWGNEATDEGHWPIPRRDRAVSLVWAVLDRASAGWRGLTMTPVGTRLLQDLRRSLLDPPRELRPPPPHRAATDQAASHSAPPRTDLGSGVHPSGLGAATGKSLAISPASAPMLSRPRHRLRGLGPPTLMRHFVGACLPPDGAVLVLGL